MSEQKIFHPGYNGLPFRGHSEPLLRQDEVDQDIEAVHDFHEAEFCLNDPEDHFEYTRVMNTIVAGLATLIFIDRYRDTDNKRKVRLEWTENFSQLKHGPSVRRPGESSIQNVG